MAEVMALRVFFGVEQDDDGRHKVDHFARRQQIQVGPSVSAPVKWNQIRTKDQEKNPTRNEQNETRS